jgi:hypothetical protein
MRMDEALMEEVIKRERARWLAAVEKVRATYTDEYTTAIIAELVRLATEPAAKAKE